MDLRIIKTRNSIKRTFFELLEKKPISKISITELCKEAQISKGTFYLHYQDIYDLYNQMFDEHFDKLFNDFNEFNLFFHDVHSFIVKFDKALLDNCKEFDILIRNHNDKHFAFSRTFELFKTKIYETGLIAKNPKNDMKLDISLKNIMYLAKEYNRNLLSDVQDVQDVLETLIHTFFDNQIIH